MGDPSAQVFELFLMASQSPGQFLLSRVRGGEDLTTGKSRARTSTPLLQITATATASIIRNPHGLAGTEIHCMLVSKSYSAAAQQSAISNSKIHLAHRSIAPFSRRVGPKEPYYAKKCLEARSRAAVGARNGHMARRILDILRLYVLPGVLVILPGSSVILSPSVRYYCHRQGRPASQARCFSNPDRRPG